MQQHESGAESVIVKDGMGGRGRDVLKMRTTDRHSGGHLSRAGGDGQEGRVASGPIADRHLVDSEGAGYHFSRNSPSLMEGPSCPQFADTVCAAHLSVYPDRDRVGIRGFRTPRRLHGPRVRGLRTTTE